MVQSVFEEVLKVHSKLTVLTYFISAPIYNTTIYLFVFLFLNTSSSCLVRYLHVIILANIKEEDA